MDTVAVMISATTERMARQINALKRLIAAPHPVVFACFSFFLKYSF